MKTASKINNVMQGALEFHSETIGDYFFSLHKNGVLLINQKGKYDTNRHSLFNGIVSNTEEAINMINQYIPNAKL